MTPPNGATSVRDQAGVDADHAVFQRLLHAGDAADVAGVEIAGQTKDRVIGAGDDFFLGVELEQGREGAEGFLIRDLAVGLDARHHGRLEERAAQIVTLAAR